MFNHKPKPILSTQGQAKNLTRCIHPEQLLADEKRQALLKQIQAFSALENARHESLCGVLIENMANYCQSLPETSNSFYALPGGLLDSALNRTEAALSLFKALLVQDAAEGLSEIQKLWQYTLLSASMLQGIGRLYVDYKVALFDSTNQPLKPWNPLLESLTHAGHFYNYEFETEAEVDFRRRLTIVLARSIMPPSGFAWIASNPSILSIWLALLSDDLRSAGTLGAILIRAEAISKQRYLTEHMHKTEHKTSRYGRAGTFSGGVPESLIEKEQAAGAEFLNWLAKSLEEGKIIINKAPLLMVPGGMLMSKELFQLFMREHPEYKNWQAIQKGFLALGLHTDDIAAAAEQQMVSGLVFSGYAIGLSDTVQVQQANTGSVQSMSAMELINGAPLQKLASSGQWQAPEVAGPLAAPGVNRRG